MIRKVDLSCLFYTPIKYLSLPFPDFFPLVFSQDNWGYTPGSSFSFLVFKFNFFLLSLLGGIVCKAIHTSNVQLNKTASPHGLGHPLPRAKCLFIPLCPRTHLHFPGPFSLSLSPHCCLCLRVPSSISVHTDVIYEILCFYRHTCFFLPDLSEGRGFRRLDKKK